ncbi:hypothetical protein [Catellatospora chokoriensis]|uniref:Protein ImuA n=1 Tax=Catellatospora chokoriensis TaxID=310353 RepID=A0A8J3NUB8_9ACTN|nr:hypothetical protein [Catellatospora chokoriensis]GIF92713.1 hypothetical protein Cch02nite_61570 [Catellatospora chokoriensis]
MPAPSSRAGVRIADAADVGRALSLVRDNVPERANTTDMTHPVARAAGLDQTRLAPALPVHDALRGLLPSQGLRRGTVVSVVGSTLLALAMLGATSEQGSWCAAVGMPDLGLAAAAEAGVELSRFVLVPHPGPQWLEVVGALLDGFEVVAVRPPTRPTDRVASLLAARARQRGAVLLPVTADWPTSDVTLSVTARQWHGLGQGHGRLRYTDITVDSRGRGSAGKPRGAVVRLPLGAGPLLEEAPTAPRHLRVV